ncbi:unnamed protein product, partial [Durusdinium trenchii]
MKHGTHGTSRSSLKEQREQIRTAIAQCRWQIERVQQELAFALKQEGLAQQKLKKAEEAFHKQLSSISPPPSRHNNTKGLVASLQVLRRQCDDLERSLSFDLFERWRRRVDWELHAGGYVEQANSIGPLGPDQGWAPALELRMKISSTKKAHERMAALERELLEAQRRLLQLRSRTCGIPQETRDLHSQLAEERR